MFLADGEVVANTNKLELILKYYDKEGKTPGCLAVINSTQYCDQDVDPGDYPLFWLDPSASPVTNWWNPVGAPPEKLDTVDGQITTCNIAANEIKVSIDNTDNRPNLADLHYTPFMVGIPVIKSFKPLASSQSVQLVWVTNNEPDISGFFLLRGTSETNLAPINGDIIPHSGNASSGYSYSRTDSGRVNGITYYYRLQVVRTDGYSFYSAIEPITVNAATATPIPPTLTPHPDPALKHASFHAGAAARSYPDPGQNEYARQDQNTQRHTHGSANPDQHLEYVNPRRSRNPERLEQHADRRCF